MARKAKQKAESASEEMVIRPEIAITETSSQFYVNAASVSHSQHEFAMAFVRLPTRITPSLLKSLKDGGGVLHTSADVQVTFAPTVMPSLIAALTAQMEKYEARFGKIGRHDV